MSVQKSIAIVGATGNLGQQIVRQSINKGYSVIAAVRDVAKAESLFSAYGNSVRFCEVNIETGEGLDDAFQGSDIVIEVISNSQRPNGIKTIVNKCESNNVGVFVACGGAGQLFTSPDRSDRVVTILEKLPDMGWARPITNLHMEVQSIAFESSIPIVMQITPPGMSVGELTNSLVPGKDVAEGINSASYQDVASVLLDALLNPEDYNRVMVGLAKK